MLESDGQGSKFFRDQDVFEQDLNNIEYTKTKLVRDSIKYTTATPGVCALNKDGTDLKVAATTTDITVQPGAGIDDLGRLIVVPSNIAASGSTSTDPYYHPAWPTNEVTHSLGNGTFEVYIAYYTQEGLAEIDDDGTSHNSRIYDSYAITVIEKDVGTPPNNSLLLAEYEVITGDIQNADVIDVRTLYSAATPSAVTVESHADNLHVDGIGDTSFIDYLDATLDVESNDYYVGSLGFKIFNNLGGTPIHSRVTIRPSIDTYVNLDGNYLTGTLTTSKAEWDSDDDTSGWYIVYLDTNKVIGRSDRALTVDGTFNLPTGSFPICKVYWDVLVAPRDLSLVEDLREWGTTKGEILGNQFNSGSLTLNKNGASIGDYVRDSESAQLNFMNEANRLKFVNDQFEFSKQLEVDGNIRSNNNIYVNYDGGDGNSYLYFYEGSAIGAYLRWDNSNNWFNFNKPLVTTGAIKATGVFGNLLAESNIYINFDGPNADSYMYFYHDSGTGKYLKWGNTNTRFEFNDTVYTSSNLRAGDNIYIDSDGVEDNSYLYFRGTTASLNWDNANSQFEFSHVLEMNANKITGVADPTLDQDAATKKYVVDNFSDTLDNVCDRGNTTNQDIYINNLYLNSSESAGDFYLYFYHGLSPTGAWLKFDDSDNRFQFNQPVQANAIYAGNIFMTGDITGLDDLDITGDFTGASADVAGEVRCDSFRIDQAPVNYPGGVAGGAYITINCNGVSYVVEVGIPIP